MVVFRTFLALLLGSLLLNTWALAHDVSPADAAQITGRTGAQLPLYFYLGAKHMVTGYDHILFLVGVIFYLRNIRTIAIFVSLFALGHSITLIAGVLAQWNVSPNLVDAIIGLSVAYKGFDNIGGFTKLFGQRPNEKIVVFVFGLFHGLGLATKLRHLGLSEDGLVVNLLSFNVGVEFGQLAALILIVFALKKVRFLVENPTSALAINLGLIAAGFAFIVVQMNNVFHLI